jgi:hypothetical protein
VQRKARLPHEHCHLPAMVHLVANEHFDQ